MESEVKRVRCEVGTIWPSYCTELIDKDLIEHDRVPQGLKNGAEQSIFERYCSLSAVVKGNRQTEVIECVRSSNSRRSHYSSGSTSFKGRWASARRQFSTSC